MLSKSKAVKIKIDCNLMRIDLKLIFYFMINLFYFMINLYMTSKMSRKNQYIYLYMDF